MSLQLANRIKLIPDYDVDSIENGIVTLSPGKSWFEYFTENELEFSEEFQEGDRFDFFSQKLNPAIIMSKSDMDKLSNRQLIVVIFSTDGTEHIWGTADNAVKFTSSTYPDRYALSLSRITQDPIF